MRLYAAICAWLEAHAQQMGQPGDEPRSEGNNFAQVEQAYDYTTMPELHIGHPAGSAWLPSENKISQPISMRWTP